MDHQELVTPELLFHLYQFLSLNDQITFLEIVQKAEGLPVPEKDEAEEEAIYQKILEIIKSAVIEGLARYKAQRDRKSDPDTIRRNVELCDLRKQNEKLWSYRRLAKHFKITPQNVGLILKEEDKWRKLASDVK
jgi:hypothetical protein